MPSGETSWSLREVERKARESNPPECYLHGFRDRLACHVPNLPRNKSARIRTEIDGSGIHRVAGYTTLLKLTVNDAGGRTRTSEVTGRLIYSQVLLPLSHAREI